MNKLIIYTITLLSVAIISCNRHKHEETGVESVSELVNEKMGKPLDLVDSLKVYNTVNETFSDMTDLLKGHRKKIVVYIDGSCFTCAEDFVLWKDMIKILKQKDISFLFYLSTDDLSLYKPYFHKWRFTEPVIIDSKNTFFHKNKISITKEYQAMLLDENNKVLVFGNPVYNEKIKDLYLKVINEKKK